MTTSGLPLSGRQVLVVEDDSDTREMLRFVLERNGAAVLAVDAVEPALEAFEKVQPDTVVADIGMPEYNGYGAFYRANSGARSKELHRQTKCVAVTAYATSADRETTLNAGFDAYVAKPFEPAEAGANGRLSCRLTLAAENQLGRGCTAALSDGYRWARK